MEGRTELLLVICRVMQSGISLIVCCNCIYRDFPENKDRMKCCYHVNITNLCMYNKYMTS